MPSGLESYLRGYEEGLKEAYNDVVRLCSKGHTPKEIQVLVKSHLASMHQKLDMKFRELKRTGDYMESITEQTAPAPKAPAAPRPASASAPVEVVPAKKKAAVKKGASYLVEEEDDENSFGLYLDAISNGGEGLCIIRKYPENVKEDYDLGNSEIIWLTKSEDYVMQSVTAMLPLAGLGADIGESDETGGQMGISPNNLSALQSSIKKFIKKNGERGIVILQGLDYLITENDFNTVLKFLYTVHDDIAFKRSRLIIPINPEAIGDEQKYKLLERAVGNKISA